MIANSRAPLWTPIALAWLLALGLFLTWGTVSSWGYTFCQPMFGGSPYESLVIQQDGNVYVQQYDSSTQVTTYRTLDGQPISALHPFGPQNQGAYLPDPRREMVSNSLTWDQRIWGFVEQSVPPNFWYLIHDGQPQGHAYWVGYASNSRQIIGYLGKHGFRPDLPPPSEQFVIARNQLQTHTGIAGRTPTVGSAPANNSRSLLPIYFISEEHLYRLELEARKVQPVATPGPVIAINLASDPIMPVNAKANSTTGNVVPIGYHQQLAVRLADRIILKDLDEPELADTTQVLPAELRESALWIHPTSGSEFVLQDIRPGSRLATQLYWVDRDGTVKRQEQVNLAGNYAHLSEAHWEIYGIAPAPILVAIGELILVPVSRDPRLPRLDYAEVVRRSLAANWPPILLICLTAIGGAIFVYRRESKPGYRGAAVWSCFVFWFGPAGLAGYWLHRNWPVQARCAECGQLVARDRLTCQACAKPFAPPALVGTEVFA